MLLMFSARVFTLSVVLSTVLSGSDQVDVCTSTGRVRGETQVLDGRVYQVFLGIPYAEPPVGLRRFRAPVPKVSWEGTLDAVNYGPSCPQNIDDVSRYYPDYVVRIPKPAQEISEDCLTLNIFSPVRRERIGNVAVMFWIHGGSCETGQGSGYDPSALASRGDVIVVTINYRLNVFGFLCTDDENAPGNYGLLDQQLALQWVHDNIDAFGGDPTRVTLFGQSAGGATAMAHLSAPRSRPLFHRVIAHSGIFAGSTGLESVGKQLKEYAKRIGIKAGCEHSGDLLFDTQMLVDCLRSKSAQVVLKAGLDVAREVIIPMLWLAVIDGNFYPKQPSPPKAISFSQYDIIAGITSNDGSPLLELLPFIIHKQVNQSTGLSQTDFDRLVQFFTLSDESLSNPFRSLAIYHEYRDWSVLDETLDNLYQVTNVMLDVNFLYGLNLVLSNIYGGANSRRMFVFDHRSTPRVKYPWLNGAPHSEELSYVFGLPFNGSGIGSLFTDDERALSDRMITYWTNIAKTGDPNVNPDDVMSSNLTYWPKYGDSEKYLLIQLKNDTPGEAYRQDKVMFWTDYLPKLSRAAVESCPDKPDGSATPDCEEVFIGEGLGFKLTKDQAESLIEVFLFVIVALLALIIIFFGAVLGYKFKYKENKTHSKSNGLVKTNGSLQKSTAFEVNEAFYSESEDTKM